MAEREIKFGQAAKNKKLENTIRSSITLAQHDNIVHYFGTIQDLVGQALVFELCSGDLTHLVEERIDSHCAFFDDVDLMIVASDLLCALRDVHRAGFVHRDVCLPNVLYVVRDHMIRLKLCDFGLAREFNAGADTISVWKPWLLDTPPEARRATEIPAAQGPLLDAWYFFSVVLVT